jgi:hypothetical protein
MLPDFPTQSILDQLLMPIEFPFMRFPPPAFDRSTIEKEGDGTDEHGNTAISFKLGFPENPIVVDLDGENGYTESGPGSAQHPILIDETPRHDNTMLKSDREPSDGTGPALLHGLTARTQQQNGHGSREKGSVAALSRMQDADDQDEPMMGERDVDPLALTAVQSIEGIPCGDTQVEPVAMARGASRSTDAILTDRTNSRGNTPADETGTLLWRHVAFYIVRSLLDRKPKNLLAQITLPQTESEDENKRMWVGLSLDRFI